MGGEAESQSPSQRGHCLLKGLGFRAWEKLVTSDWSLGEPFSNQEAACGKDSKRH